MSGHRGDFLRVKQRTGLEHECHDVFRALADCESIPPWPSRPVSSAKLSTMSVHKHLVVGFSRVTLFVRVCVGLVVVVVVVKVVGRAGCLSLLFMKSLSIQLQFKSAIPRGSNASQSSCQGAIKRQNGTMVESAGSVNLTGRGRGKATTTREHVGDAFVLV